MEQFAAIINFIMNLIDLIKKFFNKNNGDTPEEQLPAQPQA